MKLNIKKAWKKGSKFLQTWLKRLLYVVAAYALLAAIIFGWQMAAGALRSPDADLVDNSELGKAQRRTDNAEIVESIRQAVNLYRTPEYQRDAHSKAHGCVRAKFEVFDTESIYNHGIFKEAATYEAWVRFSNGSVPGTGRYQSRCTRHGDQGDECARRAVVTALAGGQNAGFCDDQLTGVFYPLN